MAGLAYIVSMRSIRYGSSFPGRSILASLPARYSSNAALSSAVYLSA